MLKAIAKRVLAYTPYRITRSALNRFQEIDHCLEALHQLGYAPGRVIDGGAHLGSFALMAARLFPGAVIHMIEPQPLCRVPLERLAAEHGFVFHPCALSSARGTVRMVCNEDHPDTGAYVAWNGHAALATVDVAATTLDALFAADDAPADRTLLKLDLQGHEMVALAGAAALLATVEVALIEVSFFQQMGEPTIPEIIGFFDRSGFELFDVAALAGRTRDDRLRQGDFLFVRRGSALLADRRWA